MTGLFVKTTETKEGLGVGLMAAETLEEYHCVLCIAALEDILLVGIGSLLVDYAVLLEEFPCVGLKHLAPEISIIAGSIAVIAEDMLEVG